MNIILFYWYLITDHSEKFLNFMIKKEKKIGYEVMSFLVLVNIGYAANSILKVVSNTNIVLLSVYALSFINLLTLLSFGDKQLGLYGSLLKRRKIKELSSQLVGMFDVVRKTLRRCQWSEQSIRELIEHYRNPIYYSSVIDLQVALKILQQTMEQAVLEFEKRNNTSHNTSKQKCSNTKLDDYLSVLGVPKGERNFEKIKKEYIKLMWKYHPDGKGNVDENLKKAKEINDAFDHIKLALT